MSERPSPLVAPPGVSAEPGTPAAAATPVPAAAAATPPPPLGAAKSPETAPPSPEAVPKPAEATKPVETELSEVARRLAWLQESTQKVRTAEEAKYAGKWPAWESIKKGFDKSKTLRVLGSLLPGLGMIAASATMGGDSAVWMAPALYLAGIFNTTGAVMEMANRNAFDRLGKIEGELTACSQQLLQLERVPAGELKTTTLAEITKRLKELEDKIVQEASGTMQEKDKKARKTKFLTQISVTIVVAGLLGLPIGAHDLDGDTKVHTMITNFLFQTTQFTELFRHWITPENIKDGIHFPVGHATSPLLPHDIGAHAGEWLDAFKDNAWKILASIGGALMLRGVTLGANRRAARGQVDLGPRPGAPAPTPAPEAPRPVPSPDLPSVPPAPSTPPEKPPTPKPEIGPDTDPDFAKFLEGYKADKKELVDSKTRLDSADKRLSEIEKELEIIDKGPKLLKTPEDKAKLEAEMGAIDLEKKKIEARITEIKEKYPDMATLDKLLDGVEKDKAEYKAKYGGRDLDLEARQLTEKLGRLREVYAKKEGEWRLEVMKESLAKRDALKVKIEAAQKALYEMFKGRKPKEPVAPIVTETPPPAPVAPAEIDRARDKSTAEAAKETTEKPKVEEKSLTEPLDYTEGTRILAATVIRGDPPLITYSPEVKHDDKKLSHEQIRDERLEPKYKMAAHGREICFSDPYQLPDRRLAVLGYVKEGSRYIARTYYLSGSQSVWRHLPRYLLEGTSHDWYDKGHGEESQGLPGEFQAALGEISQKKRLRTDVKKPWLFFTGPARNIANSVGKPLTPITEIVEVGERPTNIAGAPATEKGKVKEHAPGSLVFEKPEDEPDFTAEPERSWDQFSPIYGTVHFKLYPSKNGQYRFQMAEAVVDDHHIAWVGNIEKTGQTAQTTGLLHEWVKSDLTTPPFEYKEQAGTYGDPAINKGYYIDTYEKFLSKIPLIQRFQRAMASR